jgi:hypothetical protein
LELLEQFIDVLLKSREKQGLQRFPFCAVSLVVVNSPVIHYAAQA